MGGKTGTAQSLLHGKKDEKEMKKKPKHLQDHLYL